MGYVQPTEPHQLGLHLYFLKIGLFKEPCYDNLGQLDNVITIWVNESLVILWKSST